MSSENQTIAALALVVLAAAWLARSLLTKKKTPGCGGGCGCPSTAIKAKLGR